MSLIDEIARGYNREITERNTRIAVLLRQVADLQAIVDKLPRPDDVDVAIRAKNMGGVQFKEDHCECDPSVGMSPCPYCAIDSVLRRVWRIMDQEAAEKRAAEFTEIVECLNAVGIPMANTANRVRIAVGRSISAEKRVAELEAILHILILERSKTLKILGVQEPSLRPLHELVHEEIQRLSRIVSDAADDLGIICDRDDGELRGAAAGGVDNVRLTLWLAVHQGPDEAAKERTRG